MWVMREVLNSIMTTLLVKALIAKSEFNSLQRWAKSRVVELGTTSGDP